MTFWAPVLWIVNSGIVASILHEIPMPLNSYDDLESFVFNNNVTIKEKVEAQYIDGFTAKIGEKFIVKIQL